MPTYNYKYVTAILSTDGLKPNSTVFDIYTDYDNFQTAIATNISVNQLTNTLTPFNIKISKTATKIMVLDKNNNAKIYSDIVENDLCETCNLGFDLQSTSSVGRIFSGNLTGSCDTNLDEYRIYWYGPDSLTNIGYITGKGDNYSYDFRHPLIGSSALFALAGEYFPVIDKVKINDTVFSQSGDSNTLYSNNPIPARLTCFESQSVEVLPFRCDNGNSSNLPQYTHRVNFTALGTNQNPVPLNSTFLLSADTKYFSWKFKGESISDSLKLTFYGSAYNYSPIVLEYFKIGSDTVNYNITPSVFPKTIPSSNYFYKVTSLKNFIVNQNDKIVMDVIPNPINPSTNWDFYFGCLNENSVDCNYNIYNKLQKIYQSGITIQTNSCKTLISIKNAAISNLNDFWLKNYADVTYPSEGTYGVGNFYINNIVYSSGYNYNSSYFCQPSSNYPIRYQKTPTEIKVTTNNLSYIENLRNQYITNVKPLISPFSADSTNIGYYKKFTVVFPNSSGNQTCGDGTSVKTYAIHQSSEMTTGQTGSDYYISFSLPIVEQGITPDACSLNSYVINNFKNINNYTASTFNYDATTNVSSRYDKFINTFESASQQINTSTGTTFTLDANIGSFVNDTYPASGSSYTLIPYLASKTCDTLDTVFSYNGQVNYSKTVLDIKIENTNPLNLSDFNIYTNTRIESSNINTPRVWKLIYNYSGGTINYMDSNYVI